MRSSVPFKMTGANGTDFEAMMGDAPTAMNGVTVVMYFTICLVTTG